MISLILWEMHILGRNSYYIVLLNSFIHFGNRCQRGRSLEGSREMVFILKFGLCLSVYLSCISSWLDVLHGLIYSVNSIKGLSGQYMQWNSSSSHVHILWGSFLYIFWFWYAVVTSCYLTISNTTSCMQFILG
jgi:hypothetical protein